MQNIQVTSIPMQDFVMIEHHKAELELGLHIQNMEQDIDYIIVDHRHLDVVIRAMIYSQ